MAPGGIERNGLLRGEPGQLQQRLEDDRSVILLRFRQSFVVSERHGFLLSASDWIGGDQLASPPVYLGRFRGAECFAVELGEAPHADHWQTLATRELGLRLDDDERALLFYAQGMLNWHARQLFCAACGAALEMAQGGHARHCVGPACGKHYYPKIDPAVIFSIENSTGPEPMLLLGRKPDWEAGRHSVIAGFVEPGETLEDAVRREAREETGIVVDSVDYVASQPWPFPDALMCAFRCRTSQFEISLEDQELESADWFSPAALESGLRNATLSMPYSASIAWHLIDAWYRRQRGRGLGEI